MAPKERPFNADGKLRTFCEESFVEAELIVGGLEELAAVVDAEMNGWENKGAFVVAAAGLVSAVLGVLMTLLGEAFVVVVPKIPMGLIEEDGAPAEAGFGPPANKLPPAVGALPPPNEKGLQVVPEAGAVVLAAAGALLLVPRAGALLLALGPAAGPKRLEPAAVAARPNKPVAPVGACGGEGLVEAPNKD